jgi:AcrR family transcriptional regulator
MSDDSPTRQRLLREAMRLFGEHGYAATSIAMIEQAAGLSPGSGSLYKHFASKQELLTVGLDQLLEGTPELTARLEQTSSRPLPRRRADVEKALTAIMEETARAGLARLDQDRDLNRLLFRGLEAFPELMARFRDEELRRAQGATAGLLAGLADQRRGTAHDTRSEDWDAMAVVFVGAIAHYWLLHDVFGEHPSGIEEDRYVAAVARVAVAALLR